jgi:hypothetical protein
VPMICLYTKIHSTSDTSYLIPVRIKIVPREATSISMVTYSFVKACYNHIYCTKIMRLFIIKNYVYNFSCMAVSYYLAPSHCIELALWNIIQVPITTIRVTGGTVGETDNTVRNTLCPFRVPMPPDSSSP